MEIVCGIAIVFVIIILWLMLAEVIGELALPITVIAGILSLLFWGIWITIGIIAVGVCKYLYDYKF